MTPVPDVVSGMLSGLPEIGGRGQAFPFVTVDGEGFPPAALLSRTEVEVGPGGAAIPAAVGHDRPALALLRRER